MNCEGCFRTCTPIAPRCSLSAVIFNSQIIVECARAQVVCRTVGCGALRVRCIANPSYHRSFPALALPRTSTQNWRFGFRRGVCTSRHWCDEAEEVDRSAIVQAQSSTADHVSLTCPFAPLQPPQTRSTSWLPPIEGVSPMRVGHAAANIGD